MRLYWTRIAGAPRALLQAEGFSQAACEYARRFESGGLVEVIDYATNETHNFDVELKVVATVKWVRP